MRPNHSRRGPTFRRLLGLLVMAGLILVGVHELPKLANPAAHLITSGLTPKPAALGQARPLGTSQGLPAATRRPPLRVTADHMVTAHRIGPLPYLIDGNRFFAVRLSITNLGKHPWVSQPGTTSSRRRS